MHMIGRRRIVGRVLGGVALLIAAVATVFAAGTAHAVSAHHHALADNGVINSHD